MIICVAPACLFIYHSRLVTLDAFLHLKKYQQEFRGGRLRYRRRWRQLRLLFCCSAMRHYNYIQYVLFRNKVKNWYEVMADIVTAAIICSLAFFYLWNEIDEFKLPWYYLYLICMLLAQKQVMFLLKMLAFIPTYGLARRCRCCSRKREIEQQESVRIISSKNIH